MATTKTLKSDVTLTVMLTLTEAERVFLERLVAARIRKDEQRASNPKPGKRDAQQWKLGRMRALHVKLVAAVDATRAEMIRLADTYCPYCGAGPADADGELPHYHDCQDA